jgi:hypothetical protein
MKRAERCMQILKLTAELEQKRHIARSHSDQPLTLIRQYPGLTMVSSALTLGILTRILLAAPFSSATKLLGIPLVRVLFLPLASTLLEDSASMRAFIDCQYRAFRDLHR